jgi:large subunit ribosomal protein L3
MTIGLVGRKCGMTRIFTEAGVTVPVTVVEALPNRISQVNSDKTDGYRSVQVTIGARRPSRVTKALAGHFAKANVAAGASSHEFRLKKGEGDALAAGGELKVDMFTAGQIVDVTGTTVGRLCRHHEAHNLRAAKTHGNSLSHRAPVPSASARRQDAFSRVSACRVTWGSEPHHRESAHRRNRCRAICC